MEYPSYLIHYNKNHSKTNGQFVSGDGDGDGVVNDHANQKKQLTPEELKKKRAKRNAWIAVGAGAATTAGVAALMIADARREKAQKAANEQFAREFAERMRQRSYREAASKAKLAGGDW